MREVRGCIIISITIKVWFHEEEKLGHSLISQPKRGERDEEKGWNRKDAEDEKKWKGKEKGRKWNEGDRVKEMKKIMLSQHRPDVLGLYGEWKRDWEKEERERTRVLLCCEISDEGMRIMKSKNVWVSRIKEWFFSLPWFFPLIHDPFFRLRSQYSSPSFSRFFNLFHSLPHFSYYLTRYEKKRNDTINKSGLFGSWYTSIVFLHFKVISYGFEMLASNNNQWICFNNNTL